MRYVIFKPIFLPLIDMDNGTVCISNNERTFTLDSNFGKFQKIVNVLDGNHSLNDIDEIMKDDNPYVNSVIKFLTENNFLEFSDVDLRKKISGDNRYKSNLLYYMNFSNQEKNSVDVQQIIRNKTVLLLGLGGASLIAATLAGMGIGEIIALDFDKIDKSNLSRQFLFKESDIGGKKVKVTESFINGINPEVQCKFYEKKVEGVEDISKILDTDDVDIVVNGLDSPSVITSRWVNNACLEHEVPMIQAGVSRAELLFEMFLPGEACFDCVIASSSLKSQYYKNNLVAIYGSDSSMQNVSYAPYINILSGYVTHYMFNYFINPGSIRHSFYHIISTKNLTNILTKEYEKRPDCPTCNSDNLDQLISLEKLID